MAAAAGLRCGGHADVGAVGWVGTGLVGGRLLCALAAWRTARAAVEDACWVRTTQSEDVQERRTGRPQEHQLILHSHIEVTPEHNGNIFFWHFQNQHIANKQRTVIWLNGGPGCSSEDGAMMELGPYRLTSDHQLVYNNGSWNEFANVMFVDNPVGTGFSYVNTDSYVHELDEMAAQFMVFLEKWFALFPEYEHDDVSSSWKTVEAA